MARRLVGGRALVAGLVGALLSLGLAPGFALADPTSSADGVTSTWVGVGAGGDGHSWKDAANWSPAGVPASGDSVVVAPPTTGDCTVGVRGVPAGLNLASLSLSAGAAGCSASLTGDAFTVSGVLDWSSGTIDAPLTLAFGATATLADPGTGQARTAARSLHIAGTVVMDGGTLVVTPSQGLVVEVDGSLSGAGTIDGSVVSDGTVSPGTAEDDGPPLYVSGSFTEHRTSTLVFQLPGSFAALGVGGTQIAIKGRIFYRDVAGPPPGFGERQLLILSTQATMAWNPRCQSTLGPGHHIGYWKALRGVYNGGAFMKSKFLQGQGPHPC